MLYLKKEDMLPIYLWLYVQASVCVQNEPLALEWLD
jgi:hypothetical protein